MPRRIPADRPPMSPEESGKARDERRRRAQDEALQVLERHDRPYRSFEVRNPVHGTRYRVLGPEVPGILLCPCPDFGRRDVGTCKHVEAVLSFLRSDAPAGAPPTPTDLGPLWGAIERSVRSYSGRPLTGWKGPWGAGRLLIDGPGP